MDNVFYFFQWHKFKGEHNLIMMVVVCLCFTVFVFIILSSLCWDWGREDVACMQWLDQKQREDRGLGKTFVEYSILSNRVRKNIDGLVYCNLALGVEFTLTLNLKWGRSVLLNLSLVTGPNVIHVPWLVFVGREIGMNKRMM